MATITAGDFRNGVTFEMNGQVMTVIEFQHVKPGKGAAFVRTKYKNVMTGAIREESFNPTAKFEQAFVERKDMEYSYNDGDLYYFMDPESYELVPISKDVLDDNFKFVKENMVCTVRSYKDSDRYPHRRVYEPREGLKKEDHQHDDHRESGLYSGHVRRHGSGQGRQQGGPHPLRDP